MILFAEICKNGNRCGVVGFAFAAQIMIGYQVECFLFILLGEIFCFQEGDLVREILIDARGYFCFYDAFMG